MNPQIVDMKYEIPIFKIDEEKRIVYGKALIPDKIDKQGDIITEEDIESVAHSFMIEMQNGGESNVGFMHQVFKNIGYFVESYIDKSDGSWILATHVTNDDVWELVKKGKIKGYSIGGKAIRVPVEII